MHTAPERITRGSRTGDGGMNGVSMSPGVSEFPFNGGTKGAPGNTAIVSNAFISYAIQTSTLNPVCFGGTIFLNNPAPGGSYYIWTGPNGFVSSVSSPQIANASAAMAGTYTLKVQYANGCEHLSKVVVNVKECVKTGIEENEILQNTFYPNPVKNGSFTVVAAGDIELSIFDANGKKVFGANLREGETEINAAFLSEGLYMVRFKNSEHIPFGKLIRIQE